MKSGKNGHDGVEVLIAEDSPTQAEQLRYLIEQHGCVVVIAANGKEALAAARRRKPNLIISDVMMPEMDGYGLCKAIKSDEKLKNIPFVLVTMLSDPQDVIRGLECGADNFLRKPYDERYLLSCIDHLLMNLDLRKNRKMQIGVEIELGGRKHFVTAERQQILDLLISTYEQAVEINSELKLRERELEHSNQVLNALYGIAEGLNQAGSEREVAEAVLERALELPGIQAGWISVREGESGFRLAAARNLPPALEAPGAMEGDCTCRRRLISGELDSVTNIRECERLGKVGGDTRGLRYHASVPLWLGDRTLGVMNLVGPEKGLFNDEELRVLYSVGNQVAVALERARLREHLEQLVEERTAKLEAEIVERNRIEEEQARLVAIIEAMPDFVATGDLDGHALYMNQAGLRMLGYEPGQDVSELRVGEGHPDWALKLVRETGIPHAIEHGTWSGETAFLRRDGREIPVSQVIIAHKGASGSVEYLSTIARDVTQRRLAEATLKKSQTLLNETGKLANVGGWELHIDTQEVLWTEEVYRIHEVELTYKPTLSNAIDFCVPSSKPIIEQVVQRAIEHGMPFDVELEIITAKGNRRWVHSVGKADREHRRVHGAFQDITERKQAEAQLNESNERLRQISENIHEVFWMAEVARGEILYISPAYETIWGRTVDSLYASPQDWIDGIHSDDRQRVLQAALTKQVAGLYDEQYRIVKPDGNIRWIHDRAFPVRNSNGEVYRVVGVAEDITLRKEQENRITRLNRVYAVLSGINMTIVRARDRQELFDDACRIAVEAGQFPFAWIGVFDRKAMEVTPVAWNGPEGGLLGLIRSRFAVADGAPGERSLIGEAVRRKKPAISNDADNDPRILIKKLHMELGIHSLAILPMLVSGETVAVLALHAEQAGFFNEDEMKLLTELAGDISFALDHLEKAERLNYLAYYDVLTGIPNRTLLRDRIEQRTDAAHHDRKVFAVMLLDLEKFRTINETLGQHGGDELLRQVTRRLQDGLDETDILARPGGNLFAIVTRRTDDGVALAQLLEQTLFHLHGQPFEVEGKELRVVAKAGVAVYPGDGEDADILYRNAEAALEKAKRSGDRYLFYTPEFNARVVEKLTLENKLRRAVERGEMVLHYQPKIELKKRRISGLEALMRWNDPDTGLLVPPFKFIPIMEETGLILDAGRWALEQAVADSGRWKGNGLKVPRIAVNVSAIQLRQKDFVATVERALGGAGEAILELEITESLIMQDIETNIEKLRAVRDLGVEIAVDDFGTGYSSLAYIARLPIGSLKIDRAFIINMTSNPDDLSIVSTIISLGHSLSLKVIAEGVETEEQANLLRLLKCDEFQGYLFSPTVPAEQVELLLRENKSPPKSPR